MLAERPLPGPWGSGGPKGPTRSLQNRMFKLGRATAHPPTSLTRCESRCGAGYRGHHKGLGNWVGIMKNWFWAPEGYMGPLP